MAIEAMALQRAEVWPAGAAIAHGPELRRAELQVGGGAVDIGEPSAAVARPIPLEARLPSTFLLGSVRHPQLRVRIPIQLVVLQEGTAVKVWSEEFETLGRGPYLTAAVEDFQRAVARLYLSLRDVKERPNPRRAIVWQRLQAHLEERDLS